MTAQPKNKVGACCERWASSLALLLSGLSSANWQPQPDTDANDYLPVIRLRVNLGNDWMGGLWVSFSEADAEALLRMIQPADPNPTKVPDSRQRDALVDLVQQWADFAARAQEADFGKLAPEVSREESAPVGVPMSRLLHVSDGAVSLAAMLEMDEKCEMSLGGGGQVVNQASPGAASARIAELMRQGNLGLLMDVELDVRLQFGCRQTTLRDVLELATGAVLELDREIQEPVDLLLNGRVIARGEVVVVDGNYGLRVTEVATAQQRVDSL